jgi:glycosyltransferase involved in cell wall biosynthesis
MHITILSDPIDTQKAGIHIYTKNLAKALLKADKHNRYTFIHKAKNPFFGTLDHYTVGPAPESYRRFIAIPKLIKRLNPDVVLEPAHIGPFRTPKKSKRVTLVHDLTAVTHPHLHRLRNTLPHHLLQKRVLSNADLILAISNTTKNDIIKKYDPKTPIEVIYSATENPNLSTPSPQIPTPYILSIGTIEPRKNLETLIDTFLELKQSLPPETFPHKLIIGGGKGWKSTKLLKKISAHPDIILTGYITEEEKASLYEHADMFVYPSLYEGFGLPPLEAMSYNTPVICSTGGSLKEVFTPAALMFEPKDKEQLKNHILSLLKNPETTQELIQKGHSLTEKYTWDKVAERTLRAFENLF